MKYMMKIIMGMAAVLLLFPSCTDELSDRQKAASRKISLSFSVTGGSVTRATETEETKSEFALKRLDVFFFDSNGDRIFYQALQLDADLSSSQTKTVYLNADKDDYESTAFTVYAIANSNETAVLENVNSLDGLQKVVVTNDFPENLGSESSTSFLMDGKAEVDADDIENIRVELKRAAAKIVVKLVYEGEERNDGTTYSYQKLGRVQKRIMHYATATSLLSEGKELSSSERLLKSPDNMVQNGQEANEADRVVFYSYANDWDLTEDEPSWETLQSETYLLLDVPVTETVTAPDGQTDTKDYIHNYYRIPLDHFSIEEGEVETAAALRRNHCYTITATLKSLGSSQMDTPVELQAVIYKVEDWAEQQIDVSKDDAEFLEVNKTEYDFRNTDEDHSLEFESSSPIESIDILECWYIDKVGVRRTIVKNNNNQSTGDYRNDNNRQEKFPASTYRPTFNFETGNSGTITVNSRPLVNTPKYMKIKITNEDGNSKEVTIVQYPLEYITPIRGYYSYRTDFNTYYEKNENGYTAVYINQRGNSWNWEYRTNMDININININNDWKKCNFGSKVARNYNEKTGLCDISYYYEYNRNRGNWSYYDDGNHNPNMYHVRITSVSSEYILGIPKVNEKGYTVSDDLENAKMVSPSFMIASQLGTTYTGSAAYAEWTLPAALDHCSKYIEVGQDGTEYRNWRLPTKAELEIIKDFQDEPQSAMSTVLGGDFYWGADGAQGKVQIDPNPSDNNPAIRCVRDVHVQEEQTK